MKTIIDGYPYISFSIEPQSSAVQARNSQDFLESLSKRRSVREFSDKEVPLEVIENIIKTAATAPSGANKQPWTFCLISDKELKKKIKEAAEQEEKESYESRMSEDWIEDLKPLGTDWQKPFLETAPYLIVIFKRIYEIDENGNKRNNYYVQESVGIAAGLLIAAIHNAGLATLTHTPSPMNFLSKLLDRPANEKPFLLLPIGYPADECWVPDINKKAFEEIYKKY
ncbi:nitroreductase family protein [Lacihabitans sp. LS3-19]|uniref:nitroreductase family protein n=1 Tax=Lacihabitans sp. LS3-19 TaxID=2487335 RepID=UPI0020CC7E70|nr:nitroreductase family protein [Lacihabitans sp. LS3-19]MCP9768291.1 nitroreductase family protein [Lacihabitans sp. LS3-19]